MRLLPERLVRGATFRAVLGSYLLVGLLAIVVVVAAYTVHVGKEVEHHARVTTRMLARMASETLFASAPDSARLALLSEAIGEVAFPFVITDSAGRPRLWNSAQVGVPLPDDYRVLLTADPDDPQDPRVARVLELVERYDRERDPIEVTAGAAGPTAGRLHYGDSSLTRKLIWLPWLEAGLIVAFMGVALVAFRNRKRSEQRRLWVGMAKETAHQLGTPLTSLQGWLALLAEGPGEGGPTQGEILGEIDHDVARLNRVAARFSQIGSVPRPDPGDLGALLEQVAGYFRVRLPHLGKQVRIECEVEEGLPPVPMVRDLVDWALENLVKNALDAIDKEQGVVRLRARRVEGDRAYVELTVADNGKGMPAAVQKEMFRPGFTTKARGWGMGLVLVHRIVVEYHHGHVQVAESTPGEGTTMRLLLPVG